MKQLLITVIAALMVCGCEKPDFGTAGTEVEGQEQTEQKPGKTGRRFTFTLKGDFGNVTFTGGATRGYLSDNEEQMTDLWVFDYMGDSLVQSLHQTAAGSGEAWGRPQMELAFGSHHVYFVASRGAEPRVDTLGRTIAWATVRDTYWADYEVSVTSTSNGNRAVTLDRVVTKLKVTATDCVPEGCAKVVVKPSTWYYGLNYATGAPVAPSDSARTVSVPSSYAGTTGSLSVSVMGISRSTEWTTDVDVTACNAAGGVIGHAVIASAPFMRNRASEYSGALFGAGTTSTVSLNSQWLEAHSGAW